VKKIIFILLISISSCNGIRNTTQFNSTKNIKSNFELPKSKFAIIKYKKDWHWIFKEVEPAELNKSELIKIESILKIVIKENNKTEKKNLKTHNRKNPNNKEKETGYELSLKGKMRQYVAVINKNGEKEVWVNFFCDAWESDNWKKELMLVFDGGNCYFSLKINLTKKTYSDLSINGIA
jgi:hypothetical protein